jgi:hypothetical protein
MTREELLAAGPVEFATLRPAGSDMAVLDRRVVVTGPPALVDLSRSGDLGVLDSLVELLGEAETAWSAEVLLAAMTRREEKEVELFAGDVDGWWETLGRDARERWSTWLAESRDSLRWDADQAAFTTT